MNESLEYWHQRATQAEAALLAIVYGLADTGSTPGQRMTRITKQEAYEIAHAALADAKHANSGIAD